MMPEFSSLKEKQKFFNALTESQKIEALNEIIRLSEHIVFLGGAGVSTESGIPDFRSQNGLYHKRDKRFSMYKPEYLLSYDCLHKKPAVFFDYFRKNLDCRTVQPNDAHYKLAEMENVGKLDGVITQNIDGLHQKAGSRNVIELHGSTLRNFCMNCGKAYSISSVLEAEGVPRCSCGGMIKPDVVLYEESLHEGDMERAITAIRSADLFIIGGTSLTVYPAAGLVEYYRGDRLVLINKSPTPYDRYADLCISESIGKVFRQCVLE